MVKNAVIVPTGSKGGFVVKRAAGPTRAAIQAEGIECYKILMRGMLDLTDNIVGGKVVPPADVVRHDGDDPYLVVAADKGTATFSDIANAHLRGIRLLARRCLRLGRLGGLRPQGDGHYRARRVGSRQAPFPRARHAISRPTDFTCVGVGDMSGDVFGNGHAALETYQAGRGVRSSAHFSRSRSGSGARASPSGNDCSICRARAGRITTKR